MSDLDDQTPASPSESILLAAQVVPTTVPIIATAVPAPTASQFSEELEKIRVAESLMSLREGPRALFKGLMHWRPSLRRSIQTQK